MGFGKFCFFNHFNSCSVFPKCRDEPVPPVNPQQDGPCHGSSSLKAQVTVKSPLEGWLQVGLRGVGGFGWVSQLSHTAGNATTTHLELTCHGQALTNLQMGDRIPAKRQV